MLDRSPSVPLVGLGQPASRMPSLDSILNVDVHVNVPTWMDVRMSLDEPLVGLPTFVTPAWFRRHAHLSATNVRRLREAFVSRRRKEPGFLPWWPDDVKLGADDLFWFAARAAIGKSDSVELSKLVAKACKSSAPDAGATMFEGLISPLRQREKIVVRSLDDANKDAVYAVAYQNGTSSATLILSAHIKGEFPVSTSQRDFMHWFLDRYPECLAEAERAMALKVPPTPEEPSSVVEKAGPAPEDEIRALRAMVERLEGEVSNLEAEKASLVEDLNDLSIVNADLAAEIAAGRSIVSAGETTPVTMDELRRWIATDLGPDVVVLPRAMRSLRKASDVDVSRMVKGLRFLRDVYGPARRGGGATGEAYRASLVESGFDEGPSFSSDGSLEAFPEYTATWGAKTIHLDRHLKRGIGNATRTMIRIYFHWDRESGAVVIGHMPGHLANWRKN